MLIIDEAQNLTDELLEQVRLLSNIEPDDRKLLQIVLLGQPELRDRLNSPRLRQLRQRITVRYHLAPLTRFEVTQYIQHRLELAGAKGVPHFTRPAFWRIFRYSRGIPRLVNAVCDKALLAGFVEHSDRITHPAWWAAPSANSKETFTHEPDQRCAQARPPERSGMIAVRRACRCRPSNRPRAAAPAGFLRPVILFLAAAYACPRARLV